MPRLPGAVDHTSRSNPMSKTSEPIVLEQPIKRGEGKPITEISLRKPAAVPPALSQPTLTEQEAAALDPADLLACADAVAGFLQKKGAESPAA